MENKSKTRYDSSPKEENKLVKTKVSLKHISIFFSLKLRYYYQRI